MLLGKKVLDFLPLRRFKKSTEKLPNGQNRPTNNNNIRKNGFSITEITAIGMIRGLGY
jgi:hypothetical protein